MDESDNPSDTGLKDDHKTDGGISPGARSLTIDEMFTELYLELRRAAHRLIWGQQSLPPTGLVHEAWIRINEGAPVEWTDDREFICKVVCKMRCILIDRIRRNRALRRGGTFTHVNIDEASRLSTQQVLRDIDLGQVGALLERVRNLSQLDDKLHRDTGEASDNCTLFTTARDSISLLALDDAVEELRDVNERHWNVAVLRIYGGCQHREIAAVLNVSEKTVKNDWAVAEAWLKSEVRERLGFTETTDL